MTKNRIFKFLFSFFIFVLATSFFILLVPQYSYAEESEEDISETESESGLNDEEISEPVEELTENTVGESLKDFVYINNDSIENKFQITGNQNIIQEFADIKVFSDPNVEIITDLSIGSVVIFIPEVNQKEIIVLFENLPHKDLYFYIDSLENGLRHSMDEDSTITLTLNGHEPHLIFIKSQRSTKTIRNDATGGDCSTFGTWDSVSLICTMTQDVFEVIQITSDGITLDGNGHMVKWSNGFGIGGGIRVAFRRNVTVKNLIVEGFDHGFDVLQTRDSSFINNETRGFGMGFYVAFSSIHNLIEGNLITNVSDYIPDIKITSSGIYIAARNTKVINNTISVTHIGVPIRDKNNQIYNNNFLSTPSIVAGKVSSSILYQSLPIGGNYYRSYNIPSEGCNDINNDFICDSPITFDNLTDNLPWIYKNGWSGGRASEKLITSFSFQSLIPAVAGVINETTHTISLIVPFGTNITALVSTISVSDEVSISPDNNIAQDFTNPVVYTVTAEDGSTEEYTVTVMSSCLTDCFSNILFLPGLMGSRLYEEGLDCGTDIVGNECGDQELWISTDNSSQKKLLLDVNGKSINNLYTKDDTQKLDGDDGETGIVDEILVFNIYKSFISDLQSWKQDEIIEDYDFIPYDWRLSLEDIITNGSAGEDGDLSYDVSQDFSESFILQKLEDLQETSKSGKVTIVAHSNGGLVAKALVQKLQDTDNPLYDKIDKIIFVAVPQIGTPDAVVALLHGIKLGSGFVMKNDMSRELAENMSTVYNLLPSANYFNTVDPAFAIDKIVSFENNSFFDPQTEQYGIYVSDPTELENYILGTDNRTKPEFGDVVRPNIGNSFLYNQAKIIHQMLDDWAPSTETKVIQVAGWGEETIAGLDYRVKKNGDNESLTYKPRFVIDGDGAVVVPSALWMSDSEPNVERWWVDLEKYNEPFLGIDRVHRDILEISNLRDFIKSKINDTIFSDTENIVVNNTDTLNSNDNSRLHFTLHSPLTLGIVDVEGRYTGLDPVTLEIRQEIPGVTYRQIGEVQFLSVPAGVAYTLQLQGYEEGFFSLDVDEQQGNEITDSILFEGIASSTSTFVTLEISSSSEVSTSELKIDSDGDGDTDKTYQITDSGKLLVTNVAQAVEAPTTRGRSSFRPKVVVNQPKDETKKEETMVEDEKEVIEDVVIVATQTPKEKVVNKVAVVVPEKALVVTMQDKLETNISQIKPEELSASVIDSGANVGFWGTMKMFVSNIFSWW